jgi:hypothetical protein
MDSNYWSRHGETPLGRAMWFPRTAPPARRGTDPERDEVRIRLPPVASPGTGGRGLKNHRLATHDEQGPQRDGEGIFPGRRGNDGAAP